MNELIGMQQTYETVRIWTIIAAIAGIPGMGLAVIGLFRKNKFLIGPGIALFMHLVLAAEVMSVLNDRFTARSKKLILEILVNPQTVVKVCGNNIEGEYRQLLLGELCKMREIGRHHSHPDEELKLEIYTDTGNLGLKIMRDSNIKTEYWIFWNRFSITSDNAIGYIRTDAFDGMDCKQDR